MAADELLLLGIHRIFGRTQFALQELNLLFGLPLILFPLFLGSFAGEGEILR